MRAVRSCDRSSDVPLAGRPEGSDGHRLGWFERAPDDRRRRDGVPDRPGEHEVGDLLPFAFSWGTRGASRALQIPVDELALHADVVRSASTRLATGPLTHLVTQHIIDLFREADRIAEGPQAAMVGDVSIDLVRALLSSAAADGRSATRDVLHDTLLARVREFVRQNLRHPGLGPRMIADAHNVSGRHLYELCAGAGISLEQLIITRRLQGARDALGRPDSSHRTIAHEWGFRDATHFGRRFRAGYGTTPGEHRARAAAPAGRIRARRE